MITADHHLHAIEAFDERAAMIAADRWDRPVASCPGWDVRALVTHVAEETLALGLLVHGEEPDGVDERVGRLVCADDPFASWRRAAAYTRCVLDQAWLGNDVTRPGGVVRASDYVAEVCCATVVHTWDLAVAIGSDPTIDHVLVAACSDWFAQVEPTWRERGLVGPAVDVSDDVDAQTELLARFGRPRSSP